MHIFLYFYLWYYMGLMMEILKPSELGKTPEIWGESIKIYKNESKNVEIGLFTVGPINPRISYSNSEKNKS